MSRQTYTSRAALLLPALAFTLVIALSYPSRAVRAAAGDLDASFDSDGKLTTDILGNSDEARGVAVQPDGKIVAAGWAVKFGVSRLALALVRYNTDGSLDQTFGTGGKVTTQFPGGDSGANAVAIQPDGKIVTAGAAGGEFGVVRYNANGTLDETFGTGGQATTLIDGGAARALALQPDGKIVAAGTNGTDFAVVRFLADGTPDPAFGQSGGVAATSFDTFSDAEAVAIQPDGKIVAVGNAGFDFGVARYEANGQLDHTFNTGGRQAFAFTAGFVGGVGGEVSQDRFDRATAVVVQPDGRILIGGSVQTTNNNFSPALARLRPDGLLDTSFSGNGLAVFRQGAELDSPFSDARVSLALQPNGKAVAASLGLNFNVLRVNLDGSLDQTFGVGGVVMTDFDTISADHATGVSIGPDGRIVVVGTTSGNTAGDFAVARYLGDVPAVQCLYGLSHASQVVASVGEITGSVQVFAPAGCAWTAASNAPWIDMSPAAGGGNGTVNFTVEPTAGGPRTGTLTIAGQTFTVAQGGFKVAVYYSGGQGRAEPERARLAATGLFAQVDAFTVNRTTTPTLAHLLQYDAVYYFHNQFTGPPHARQDLFGNVLADYIHEHRRGVVVAGNNWNDSPGDALTGNVRLRGWLPFTADAAFRSSVPLVKRQPAHPVLEGVSAVESGGHIHVGLSQGAELLADWGDGVPAVAVKRPESGRVVGLNLFPPSAGGADAARLINNSLLWAAEASTKPSTSFEFELDTIITVSEAAGGAEVAVLRKGDLSAASTAVFSTEETSAPVRCDVITGSGYAHCDFETTVVTLDFAPGEERKTVRVPVIDDGHDEGPEGVRFRVRGQFGAEPFGDSIILIITDDDGPDAPNPFFNHAFFVRQHYLDFLTREPEPSGLAAWVAVLNNCPDVENTPGCDRPTVSGGFFRADEFARKGYYVFRFYRAAFGRLPTYAEMIADMQSVGGATPAEVVSRRAAFAGAFTERAEFLTTRTPPGTTDAAYVNALMDRYGLQTIHTPDPANPEGGEELTLTRDDLRQRLAAHEWTRGQVLRAVVESREVDAAEFNNAFVAMQYYGYLRRAPELPGYTNWLDYLNAHPTDFRTMIQGFINSVEYRLRFGRP